VKILVCVKSVPETESSFRIDAEGKFYEERGLKFKVNEYDLYAVEEAVRIKERFKDVEITIVSVGPARIEAEIKNAMSLGAEYGFRIDDSRSPVRDALSVASLISAWARPKKFDLVFCGVVSEDLQRCQTGPMIAELLEIRCATTIVSLNISEDRKKIICGRELESGLREKVELPIPALVTIQSGINIPRYASLSNVLRVKKMEIPVVPAQSLGAVSVGETAVRAFLPGESTTCEFLEGAPDKVAERLIQEMRSRGLFL